MRFVVQPPERGGVGRGAGKGDAGMQGDPGDCELARPDPAELGLGAVGIRGDLQPRGLGDASTLFAKTGG